jgi:hypothetical protein
VKFDRITMSLRDRSASFIGSATPLIINALKAQAFNVNLLAKCRISRITQTGQNAAAECHCEIEIVADSNVTESVRQVYQWLKTIARSENQWRAESMSPPTHVILSDSDVRVITLERAFELFPNGREEE